LEFSFVWHKVNFREFIEQELKRAFVFDFPLLVRGAEDFVGRAHDIAVVLDGANFDSWVFGLGGFKC
jgi:hypothetical protein